MSRPRSIRSAREQSRAPTRRLKPRWVRILAAVFLLFCVYAGYEYGTLPDVAPLAKENPKTTALMEQRAEEAQDAGRKPRKVQHWVSLNDLPKYAVDAVLLSEDARFYQHEGVDLVETTRALEEAWENKELGRGASTITQQLAKNLFLSNQRSLLRKAKELILARRLEEKLTKRRILTLYLNIAEWGDGVYGIDAGARAHFGVGASELSPGKAAMLASMLPSPKKWTPALKSQRLKARSLRLVDRMAKFKRLTPDQAASARAEIESVLSKTAAPSDDDDQDLDVP